MSPRPPLPPCTDQTARQKVQAAEDAWNTRVPARGRMGPVLPTALAGI
jgi:nuclear transport factor 2 (NTF2) superfamily protein